MKLEFEKGKALKDLLQTCSRVTEELLVTINSQGLTIKGMNAEHTAHVSTTLSPDFFATFDVEKEVQFGLHAPSHVELFRRIPQNDRAELSFDENKKLNLSTRGTLKRAFCLSTMMLGQEELPDIPALSKFTATAKIPSEALAEMIAQTQDVKGDIQFTLSPDSKNLSSTVKGEMITAESEVEAQELTAKEEASSKFSARPIGLLSPFLSTFPADLIEVHLGTDFPIKVVIPIEGEKNTVTFALAPLIGGEEEPKRRHKPKVEKPPEKPQLETEPTPEPTPQECFECHSPIIEKPYATVKTDGEVKAFDKRECYLKFMGTAPETIPEKEEREEEPPDEQTEQTDSS